MKAISPMIAVVLLIAFTVAVGGILSVWFSTLTTTQTTIVGSATQNQIVCASVDLAIREVRLNITNPNPGSIISGKYVNITMKYDSGTAILTPNVTGEVIFRGERNTTTVTKDLSPGESYVISVNVSRTTFTNSTVNGGITGVPEVVRIRTWCQNTSVSIIAECKSGQPCMLAPTT